MMIRGNYNIGLFKSLVFSQVPHLMHGRIEVCPTAEKSLCRLHLALRSVLALLESAGKEQIDLQRACIRKKWTSVKLGNYRLTLTE